MAEPWKATHMRRFSPVIVMLVSIEVVVRLERALLSGIEKREALILLAA